MITKTEVVNHFGSGRMAKVNQGLNETARDWLRWVPCHLACLAISLSCFACGGGSGGSDPGPIIYPPLDYSKNGNEVTFSWVFTETGDEIQIFRGDQSLITIQDTSIQTYVHTESKYGYIRFSACLRNSDGSTIARKDALVDFGKVSWDPPQGDVSGYYLYLAENTGGDPYQLLPYGNHEKGDFDAWSDLTVPLYALYQNALIQGDKDYYIAASSYYVDPVSNYTYISVLTAPMTFTYEVILAGP